ncbi:hypothetical protein [Actinomadura rudentiformis]|uniref:Uncharacterized protein n=1 Tax=Actinomadura rudentiformis TaxID=359158 RepID=A0A6H9YW06_9ACTN|nr:hypothetical protein [Actinomadura rudentiformis]KAB2344896.1 hypothetical protein F8566_30365 [Actinomadura rudentiformis]
MSKKIKFTYRLATPWPRPRLVILNLFFGAGAVFKYATGQKLEGAVSLILWVLVTLVIAATSAKFVRQNRKLRARYDELGGTEQHDH